MRTDNLIPQLLVSKLCGSSSIAHRIVFGMDSISIWLCARSILLPEMNHIGVGDCCDLHRPLWEEHSGVHWVRVVLATGPGLERKMGSVRFQTHPETQPRDSLWAKPGPVPVNLSVSPDLARPVGSNLHSSI